MAEAKKPIKAIPSTKAKQMLVLLKRKNGASLPELEKVSGWQNHSVRGFLSATVKKRMKLKVTSLLTEKGERRYRIAA